MFISHLILFVTSYYEFLGMSQIQPYMKSVKHFAKCCLICEGYKGFGPAELHNLYYKNFLRGGEYMRNLL